MGLPSSTIRGYHRSAAPSDVELQPDGRIAGRPVHTPTRDWAAGRVLRSAGPAQPRRVAGHRRSPTTVAPPSGSTASDGLARRSGGGGAAGRADRHVRWRRRLVRLALHGRRPLRPDVSPATAMRSRWRGRAERSSPPVLLQDSRIVAVGTAYRPGDRPDRLPGRDGRSAATTRPPQRPPGPPGRARRRRRRPPGPGSGSGTPALGRARLSARLRGRTLTIRARCTVAQCRATRATLRGRGRAKTFRYVFRARALSREPGRHAAGPTSPASEPRRCADPVTVTGCREEVAASLTPRSLEDPASSGSVPEM